MGEYVAKHTLTTGRMASHVFLNSSITMVNETLKRNTVRICAPVKWHNQIGWHE